MHDDPAVFDPESPTMSEHVQDYVIDVWDIIRSPSLAPRERAEADELHKMVDAIVDGFVKGRELVTDTRITEVEAFVADRQEFLRHKLDERFTRNLIQSVPGYVERTMRLSRLEAHRVASATTNRYLQEAVRTYIFGFAQASVALSRAALEQALKESLARQGAGDFIKFQDLLKEARKWNILDSLTEHMARDVAREGDRVLHERPTDLEAALEVLTKARGLVQHIFSVEGRF